MLRDLPTMLLPAELAQPKPGEFALSGAWTAFGIGAIDQQLPPLPPLTPGGLRIDAARLEHLDSAGAWVLEKFLGQLRATGNGVEIRDLRPEFGRLLASARQRLDVQAATPVQPVARPLSLVAAVGQSSIAALEEARALLAFVGETALALGGCLAHPGRIRWRPIFFNIRSAGVDALPIVGLLSFLLGIVVAYQGADQLRQYGANIFVADLVGLSMLREFAPLMTAIIIAGRSGSAYAAQIGSMAVSEEIDAMRTLGLAPQEILVLPKLLALLLVLPLLTVFADVLGVFGGMLMAQVRLDVGFTEFLERFVKAVSLTALISGLGKAPVFAMIIVIIGCFEGFRTAGGADSVGRQTTRSVVHSIFLVIVVDALFSVAYSALDL
ncbi:MAG: ABC transporter permease [Azonexus sp.]